METRAQTFLRQTDPDAVSAMRKICAPGRAHRKVELTPRERRALDRWFAMTGPYLVEAILHDIPPNHGHQGKGGYPKGRPRKGVVDG